MADLVFLKWGRQPIISQKSLLSPPHSWKNGPNGVRVVYIRKSAHGLHPPPKKSWIRHCNRGTEESLQIQGRLAKLLLDFFFWKWVRLRLTAPPELANSNYRPQTKLREGNVYTHVCQSFCSQGGLCMMSLPVWLPGPMSLPGFPVQRAWTESLDREHSGQKTPGQRAPWIETP